MYDQYVDLATRDRAHDLILGDDMHASSFFRAHLVHDAVDEVVLETREITAAGNENETRPEGHDDPYVSVIGIHHAQSLVMTSDTHDVETVLSCGVTAKAV